MFILATSSPMHSPTSFPSASPCLWLFCYLFSTEHLQSSPWSVALSHLWKRMSFPATCTETLEQPMLAWGPCVLCPHLALWHWAQHTGVSASMLSSFHTPSWETFALFFCTAAQSYEGKGSHLTFCSGKGKILLKDILHSIKKKENPASCRHWFGQNLTSKHEEKFVVQNGFTCPSNNNRRWNCVRQWHYFLSISMRWKCLLMPILYVSMLISWCVSRLYPSVWQICEMLYGNIWFFC